MDNVSKCLADWRASERRRDGYAEGSPEWQRADEDVRHARLVYQATATRTAVLLAESEPATQWRWPPDTALVGQPTR